MRAPTPDSIGDHQSYRPTPSPTPTSGGFKESGHKKTLKKMRSAGALLGINSTLAQSKTASSTHLPPPPTTTIRNVSTPLSSTSSYAYPDPPSSDEDEEVLTAPPPPSEPSPTMTSSANVTNGTGKPGKWGFLKKMSMGRMRSASNAGKQQQQQQPPSRPPPLPVNTNFKFTSGPAALAAPQDAGYASRTTNDAQVSARPVMNLSILRKKSSAGDGCSSPTETQEELVDPVEVLDSRGLPIASRVTTSESTTRGKRRSFLPIFDGPPSLDVAIPSASPFSISKLSLNDRFSASSTFGSMSTVGPGDRAVSPTNLFSTAPLPTSITAKPLSSQTQADQIDHAPSMLPTPSASRHTMVPYEVGLKSVMAYLGDLYDLSLPVPTIQGGAEVMKPPEPGTASTSMSGSEARSETSSPFTGSLHGSRVTSNRYKPSGMRGGSPMATSPITAYDGFVTDSDLAQPISSSSSRPPSVVRSADEEEEATATKRYKDDPVVRTGVIKHIVEYVAAGERGPRTIRDG